MMKNMIKIILFFYIWLFPFTAKSDCVFDNRYFSETKYRNSNFVKSFTWLDETKEVKIITINNDLISIIHWSCDVLGLSAVMLVHPDLNDSEVKKKILELGSIVLNSSEENELKKSVSLDEFKFDYLHQIESSGNRPEFYYIVRRFDGYQTIQIKYYYN
jgi:hypothetical protein